MCEANTPVRQKGQWNAEETIHDAIDRLVPPSSTPRAVSNRLPFARLLVPQKTVVARYPWVPPLQRSRTLRRTDLLKSGKADCVMGIGAREGFAASSRPLARRSLRLTGFGPSWTLCSLSPLSWALGAPCGGGPCVFWKSEPCPRYRDGPAWVILMRCLSARPAARLPVAATSRGTRCSTLLIIEALALT